jgi:hypothetical protein
MNKEIRELLDRIQTWMIENDYECGPEGNEIYKEIDKLLKETESLTTAVRCSDCDMVTEDLISKSDHHCGTKIVCRDRNACHARSR